MGTARQKSLRCTQPAINTDDKALHALCREQQPARSVVSALGLRRERREIVSALSKGGLL
jgi:hypothetical protein